MVSASGLSMYILPAESKTTELGVFGDVITSEGVVVAEAVPAPTERMTEPETNDKSDALIAKARNLRRNFTIVIVQTPLVNFGVLSTTGS
jgi:hypothetical protein